jgi:hypothetical protein
MFYKVVRCFVHCNRYKFSDFSTLDSSNLKMKVNGGINHLSLKLRAASQKTQLKRARFTWYASDYHCTALMSDHKEQLRWWG